MKKYYSIAGTAESADIYIYGDIVSLSFWGNLESDVSSYTLSKEIKNLEADTINVYINSYGGEVAEGLAIYNALCKHKAKIITYDDGFACSAASVVFMAGDERIMSASSLLMIHNAWVHAAGDANALRKEADDLETITEASVNAYLTRVNISADELKAMLDSEKWIAPAEALEKGFATSIINEPATAKAAQSARRLVMKMIVDSKVEPAQTTSPQKPPKQESPPKAEEPKKLNIFERMKTNEKS